METVKFMLYIYILNKDFPGTQSINNNTMKCYALAFMLLSQIFENFVFQ